MRQATLCFLGLVGAQLPSPASADGFGPAQLSEAARQGDLAKVLGVQPAGVSEARGYNLHAAGPASGFILGRYVQGARAWTFPVLGVYAACDPGTCISVLRLGAAARRGTAAPRAASAARSRSCALGGKARSL